MLISKVYMHRSQHAYQFRVFHSRYETTRLPPHMKTVLQEIQVLSQGKSSYKLDSMPRQRYDCSDNTLCEQILHHYFPKN